AAAASRASVAVASPAIAEATGVATTRDGGEAVLLTSSNAAARDAAEAPRARRATTPTRKPDRAAAVAVICSGRQISHALIANEKRSGSTPTTVCRRPPSMI